MIVTKVEAVTKTKYKVHVDGQFVFVLYKGELSRYHLREEGEISPEVYEEIRTCVVLKRAKLRALHLLNEMGRTEAQLREKLKLGGYPQDLIEEAVAYVKSFGYVNDLEYARNFVDSRKEKKSRKEIYLMLCQKGVAVSEIECALEECYGQEDTRRAIEKLMEKRRFHPASATWEEKQKFMAYLMRKGFPCDVIRRTVDGASDA